MRRATALRPLIAVALLAAGCAPQIQWVGPKVPPGPIATMLVTANLRSPVIAESTRVHFGQGLVRALEACHVKVTLHDDDPLSLESGGDNAQTTASLAARLRVDAVLLIRPAGSFLGNYFSSTQYRLVLLELRSKRVVWQGSVRLINGLAVSDPSETLGPALVQTMAASDTLRTCPPATGPGSSGTAGTRTGAPPSP